MDLPPADPPAGAARLWAGLDEPWQQAFRQAWEALRTGNIAVGACASTPDGQIVHSARNRVSDSGGPPGEIFGSALAHAETNVLKCLMLPIPHIQSTDYQQLPITLSHKHHPSRANLRDKPPGPLR